MGNPERGGYNPEAKESLFGKIKKRLSEISDRIRGPELKMLEGKRKEALTANLEALFAIEEAWASGQDKDTLSAEVVNYAKEAIAEAIEKQTAILKDVSDENDRREIEKDIEELREELVEFDKFKQE